MLEQNKHNEMKKEKNKALDNYYTAIGCVMSGMFLFIDNSYSDFDDTIRKARLCLILIFIMLLAFGLFDKLILKKIDSNISNRIIKWLEKCSSGATAISIIILVFSLLSKITTLSSII